MIEEYFPTVFKGLGNLGEPYIIQLQTHVLPHALHMAGNVPLPLRDKVFKRMESIGVISRIEKPTQWYAGMVAIPKKNRSIHICVDLK